MGGVAVRVRPVVSVCIANYNGSAIIANCIESVLAQDCDFPVEILVHDDASTDESAEIVARDYRNVLLIRSSGNVGFCVANNRMVAQAQGTYVLLLNNDAELYPDALRVLYEKAEKIGGPAILSLSQYDFVSGELIDRGCLLDPFSNPVPNLDPSRSDVAMVIGACLWIPRQLWKKLGGFPEWFGSIGEDLYLCCVGRLAGYPVAVAQGSGYRHRVGQSFGGGKTVCGRLASTYRRRALSERNKSYVMIACTPQPVLVLLLPLHVVALILEGILLSLLRREKRPLLEIYLPALSACWAERKRLRELRIAVQAKRRVGLRGYFSVFSSLPRKIIMLFRHGSPGLT
jgi:GT2 family glycosyltransferase